MGFDPAKSGYIMVAPRHAAFVEDHPNGRIESDLTYSIFDPATGKGYVAVTVSVFKDKESTVPDGMGLSGMQIPGTTGFTKGSELENAETSALGRALAMIGYHPKESMASQEEIAKSSGPAVEEKSNDDATPEQKRKMFAMQDKAGIDKEALGKLVLALTGKHSSKQLKVADMDRVYAALQSIIDGEPVEMPA